MRSVAFLRRRLSGYAFVLAADSGAEEPDARYAWEKRMTGEKEPPRTVAAKL